MKQIRGFFDGLARGLGRRPGDEDCVHFFSRVYQTNYWGGAASRSGRGSEGDFAAQKVAVLTELIDERGIRTILDIGCGDFYWMQRVAQRLDRYLGVDVVSELIVKNKEYHGTDQVDFLCVDLTKQCAQKRELVIASGPWDLVMCFDVFGHLLNEEVSAMLDFLLSRARAKYLLVINRRTSASREYLSRPKTRHEGIDLEAHPLFLRKAPRRVKEIAALYPGNFFALYEL